MSVTPPDGYLDTLLASAERPVEFDGLSVHRRAGFVQVVVGEERNEDLTPRDARDLLAEYPAYVTNWYVWEHGPHDPGEAAYAFTRWLEHADDRSVPERYGKHLERTWGELLVSTRIDDAGQRRYAVRHRADRAVTPDDLEPYRDPQAARELSRFDDRGQYRPLRSKPTMARGWRFHSLDRTEVVDVIEHCYPASIANWHHECEGDLDVEHWVDTAGRQTGRYADVADLPPEAVAWAAEACCTDQECLKRRQWEYDAERPLEVQRGDGAFPCREPCSFLIAAAREWAEREDEATEAIIGELTPTERRQLRAIVTRAADGDLGEIPDGDFADPANRHRIRYLAAKRFADEDPFRSA